MDELDYALEWLNEHIELRKKVLVHCRFGVGRSGTIIAAYLLKKGLTLNQVLKEMKQMPATPTSPEQREIIVEYAQKLGMDTTAT